MSSLCVSRRIAAAILLVLSCYRPANADALDARKELAALGITWSAENFRLTVFRKDYHAVELFLKSGIDPHTDRFFQRGDWTFLSLFVYDKNFDPKIAAMLNDYPDVIKPAEDCPATGESSGGIMVEQSAVYTSAANKPELAAFLRRFCNQPAVIAKIDSRIAELKARPPVNAKAIKGWLDAKSFLTGLPQMSEQAPPQAAEIKAPSAASGVSTQPPSAPITDVANFDVAGVRLGMTLPDALSALKNFDPAFVVVKRYLTNRGASYSTEGVAIEKISGSEKELAYFDNLLASKGGPEVVCDPRNPLMCRNTYPTDEETVKVWFSRVPGQERVVAVQRDKTFHVEPKPPLATLKTGALSKYSSALITYQRQDNLYETIGWLFDFKRRAISGATAKSRRMEESGGLPSSVKSGDGIGLNAVFIANSTNNPIASRFYVTLFDADALYKLTEQSNAAAAALKAKADAKAVANGAKSQSQTKF